MSAYPSSTATGGFVNDDIVLAMPQSPVILIEANSEKGKPK